MRRAKDAGETVAPVDLMALMAPVVLMDLLALVALGHWVMGGRACEGERTAMETGNTVAENTHERSDNMDDTIAHPLRQFIAHPPPHVTTHSRWRSLLGSFDVLGREAWGGGGVGAWIT